MLKYIVLKPVSRNDSYIGNIWFHALYLVAKQYICKR